jgi:hypothetical protein
MPRANRYEPNYVIAGWQGVTVEIPDDWNIGAISGDAKQGYVRFDDDTQARLEIKWATEQGFVDLDKVVRSYFADIEKARKKAKQPEIKLDPDIKLMSRRRRRKSALRCFHWKGEVEAYGAAWLCKDCGRTMIAQVTVPADMDAADAQEFAAAVLLSITDHPTDGWALWAAYGFACWIPAEFHLTTQKLMAGLIELEFALDTERIKVARWGMAGIALKKKNLHDWVGEQMAKTFRKHEAAEPEQVELHGHEGFATVGTSGLSLPHRIQCFVSHCTGKVYADRFLARTWHCPDTNRIFYVEAFLDRDHVGLVDEMVERIQCHETPEE